MNLIKKTLPSLCLSLALCLLPLQGALASKSGSHGTHSHGGSSHKGGGTGGHGSGQHAGAGHKSGSANSSHAAEKKSSSKGSKNASAAGVKRDQDGKIERSAKAKADFKKSHPCPSTNKTSGACPGYVIDHVKPLKRGGADAPSNMQWQTVKDAKAKDKWE